MRPFGSNWVMYGVESVIGFKMDVWCILSNLVDYENCICGHERLSRLVVHNGEIMEVF